LYNIIGMLQMTLELEYQNKWHWMERVSLYCISFYFIFFRNQTMHSILFYFFTKPNNGIWFYLTPLYSAIFHQYKHCIRVCLQVWRRR